MGIHHIMGIWKIQGQLPPFPTGKGGIGLLCGDQDCGAEGGQLQSRSVQNDLAAVGAEGGGQRPVAVTAQVGLALRSFAEGLEVIILQRIQNIKNNKEKNNYQKID